VGRVHAVVVNCSENVFLVELVLSSVFFLLSGRGSLPASDIDATAPRQVVPIQVRIWTRAGTEL
jgi:hypothetical protein